MRISDWSSDVCSSDLLLNGRIANRKMIARNVADTATMPGTSFQSIEYQINWFLANSFYSYFNATPPAFGSCIFNPSISYLQVDEPICDTLLIESPQVRQ